ncbi:MAG: TonB-dependent receptor [Flavobacterium sp.]|nr:TonB-dependent receptor [Flavobacterium sp.]
MKLKLFIFSILFCGISHAQDKPKKTDSEQTGQLDEIVISASRTPEKIKESPVTIERMGLKEIKKVAAPSFYDGLENLKEVQMNTSSMSFKSINTRGFASVANTRFMQLVDGMDNSSPLLNFVLGNLIGVSEIDVQSVELLPGASSALYGANAFNGILFMTSKSPFTNQGISTYLKYGQTSQQAAGNNTYYDFGVRAAHAFSKHFAAKANMTFMRGTDWWATNYDDQNLRGRTRDSYSYDGINVYGDEAALVIARAGMPVDKISRTGFKEIELTDNKVANTKIDLSLHAKPFGDDRLEIIWQSKFGFGNTVYQGASRYYLNNFFMQQHKLEFKGKNFFVRGYTTTEDGGRSYDMTFTALNINRSFKSDKNWFTDYTTAYLQSTLAGTLSPQAHIAARQFADYNVSPASLIVPLTPSTSDPGGASGIRYEPGTQQFKDAFKKVIADPDILTGSKLVDNSRIYHSDANYNFKDIIKPVEIQVGGSYRLYELNSFGRIYTDKNSKINYNEYGVYTQLQKKLLYDKLKLTGSIRYDKAQNFTGNFSPRVSAVYALNNEKTHILRASFQTGFRNPSTQDQYIGFNIGSRVLVGSAADNLDRYTETVPVTATLNNSLVSSYNTVITGNDAYFNSFTETSVNAFKAEALISGIASATSLLRKTNFGLVKPETVKAFDLGYRGLFKGFSVDLNGYYNIYNNFIGNSNAVTTLYGKAQDAPTYSPIINTTTSDPGSQAVNAIQTGNVRVFQLYSNTALEIKSLGFGAGITKKIYQDFELSGNYNYAQFDFDQSKDPSFEAGFNTPKHRAKATLSNDKLFGRLGMSVGGRWNSAYLWQSSFADGIIAEATVIDVQANYNMPKIKSTFKVGATNIGGKEYGQVLGAGLIGRQIYASWTINP